MEGLSKKEKGLVDVDKQCGDCWQEGGIKGLNDNGKNTIEIKSKHIKEKKKRGPCDWHPVSRRKCPGQRQQ